MYVLKLVTHSRRLPTLHPLEQVDRVAYNRAYDSLVSVGRNNPCGGPIFIRIWLVRWCQPAGPTYSPSYRSRAFGVFNLPKPPLLENLFFLSFASPALSLPLRPQFLFQLTQFILIILIVPCIKGIHNAVLSAVFVARPSLRHG